MLLVFSESRRRKLDTKLNHSEETTWLSGLAATADAPKAPFSRQATLRSAAAASLRRQESQQRAVTKKGGRKTTICLLFSLCSFFIVHTTTLWPNTPTELLPVCDFLPHTHSFSPLMVPVDALLIVYSTPTSYLFHPCVIESFLSLCFL